MKIFISILFITFFLLSGLKGIFAQSTQPILDQVALIKQFSGNWKCELGKDTFLISENKLFGNGMASECRIETRGEVLDEIKHLYGYDEKADQFILAELIASSPGIEICTLVFTSETKGEIAITNPENAPLHFTFEFETTDLIVQRAIQNGKVVRELFVSRIKLLPETRYLK